MERIDITTAIPFVRIVERNDPDSIVSDHGEGRLKWKEEDGDRYIVSGMTWKGESFERDCGGDITRAYGTSVLHGILFLQRGDIRYRIHDLRFHA